jgi:hypothetical protein
MTTSSSASLTRGQLELAAMRTATEFVRRSVLELVSADLITDIHGSPKLCASRVVAGLATDVPASHA